MKFLACLAVALSTCTSLACAQHMPDRRVDFSIGIGLGLGSVGCGNCQFDEDYNYVAPHLNVRLFRYIRPDLQLGLELSHHSFTLAETTHTGGFYSVGAQWHPRANARLYLKANAGLLRNAEREKQDSGTDERLFSGAAAGVGLGLLFRQRASSSMSFYVNATLGIDGGYAASGGNAWSSLVHFGWSHTWH